MTPLVQIHTQGKPARTLHLTAGKQTIGAAVDCDFLLLDEAIADTQFVVSVEDDTLVLTLSPGAQAEMNEEAMVHDIPYNLKGGTSVMVGDVTFVFDCGAPEAANVPAEKRDPGIDPERTLPDRIVPSMAPQRSISVPRSIGTGTFLVGVVLIGWSAFSDPKQSALLLSAAETELQPPADATPMAIAAAQKPERFISDLPREASDARGVIANEDPMPPAETDGQATLRASAMVLAGIDRKAKAISVTDGVLRVSGIRGDNPKAQDIRLAILADVPKLKDVQFQLSPEEQISSLRKQVAGVWAGKRPYVVRIDGEVIKPSQELYDGIILTAVSDATIEVSINKVSHTVKLQ